MVCFTASACSMFMVQFQNTVLSVIMFYVLDAFIVYIKSLCVCVMCSVKKNILTTAFFMASNTLDTFLSYVVNVAIKNIRVQWLIHGTHPIMSLPSPLKTIVQVKCTRN